MANNKKSFKDLLKSRKVRYGTLSVAFTAVTLMLILGINLVISALNASHIFNIDLTDEEFYSIGDDTIAYIEELGDDLDITIHFCAPKDRFAEYQSESGATVRMVHDLAVNFASKFPDNIEIKYFDVTSDPKYVDDIKHMTQTTLTASNVIVEGKYHTRVLGLDAFFQVAESDGRMYSFNGEARFTSAITQCSIKEKYSVIFTTGHGESASASLRSIYDSVGFEIIELNLSTATDEQLDEAFKNARLMVICNPKYDLVGYDKDNPNKDDETDIINNFLKDGYRSLMVFVNSDTPALPNLQSYLDDVWGMNYEVNKVVSDETHALQNKYSVLGNASGVTGNMSGQLHITIPDDAKVVFNKTTYLTLGSAANGAESEAAFNAFDTATVDGKTGNYPLFAIATLGDYVDNARKYQFVTLCASTEFVSDSALSYTYGNREVIESAARMMSTERVAPDIDPKVFVDTALTLEMGEAKTLSVIVIVVAPLIVLVLGIGVYIKRRHL